MSNTVYNRIFQAILKKEKGSIVFPVDFRSLGPNTDIRKALSKLVKDEILIRLGHGIYLYPRHDRELGPLYPSPEDVAKAIAQADHARIIPSGSHALYKLRLTQQIPMKLVYLTDGIRRNIKIGKTTIVFTITTPRKMATKGEISGLVIQALEALGKKQITPETLARIKDALLKEDPKNIIHDATLAPAWVADILFKTLNNSGNGRMAEPA